MAERLAALKADLKEVTKERDELQQIVEQGHSALNRANLKEQYYLNQIADLNRKLAEVNTTANEFAQHKQMAEGVIASMAEAEKAKADANSG